MFLPILLLLSLPHPTLPTAIPVTALAPVRPPKGSIPTPSLSVSLTGSGCTPSSVSVNLAPDNSALTIIFDNFVAADGPKAISSNTRALCKITLAMKTPGWVFDIASADFRGYVWLEKGVGASLVSRWKWVDGGGVDLPGKGNVQKKLTGPFEDDVLLHKDGELSDAEPSVCQKKDAKLQISMSATVDSGVTKKNGYVQGGSADAAFKEVLNISWRKC
ncbi:hypothetical protein T440DRAFT_408842 [Plenodomus tracheiphilus IPT5]|uniref:DUF4360 domain-containing protein n=1 Tax=Plenodomus tracheiphilus IPT5 TaxID=1408161 RepID=A0A6A7AQQ3_9PLEO|nr:hypothetical protein T440DRAFT_408842 [Plenodomus tracheiphilus IPT5]